MASTQSSPSEEAQTVTVEALMAAVDPFFRNLTQKERLGLANGNPAPSTTCALEKTFGDILELFTCNVLHSLPKERCTMKELKAAVGNKVPEALAKVLEIEGDIHNEHTQNLNRLIVQYLLARVNHSLDSGTSIITHMVDETSLILEDLLDRFPASVEDFKKPADGKTCEAKSKIKGLTGKIKRFFRNFTGRHSSKVAPMIIQEQPETSLTEIKPTLNIQVEDEKMSAGEGPLVDKMSDIKGCEAEVQLAEVKETTAMAAVIPPEVQATLDLQEEEDKTSPAELFVPPDVADVENSVPDSQSTKESQEIEVKPKVDEISPVEAFIHPEILLTENLLENESEPESSSDDSSSAFTPSDEDEDSSVKEAQWGNQMLASSVLDDEGNEELTDSHVCSEEESEEKVSQPAGLTVSHPVPNFKPPAEIREDMTPAELELEETETDSISEPKEDQGESEEVAIRKTALRSLVREVIQRIIDKSGQSSYPPEEHCAICVRLFEKLWAETKAIVLKMSPEKITGKGKAIFKDLMKGCNKAENILLLLEAGTMIIERNVLTTIENRLQPWWKTFASIKKAFK